MDPNSDSWPSLSESAQSLVEHGEAHGVFIWPEVDADGGTIKSGKVKLAGWRVQEVLRELDDLGLVVCYPDGRWALTELGLRLRYELRCRTERSRGARETR